MRKSHFLFLGYSLKDWNLRVILNRLRAAGVAWNSWAVQPKPDNIEERFWFRRNIELLDARLETYIGGLSTALLNGSAAAPSSAMTDVLTPRGDSLQAAPACPYKGLGSYTEADKDYFFARDSFRDLVAANLMASRLTVLYGPSGVG